MLLHTEFYFPPAHTWWFLKWTGQFFSASAGPSAASIKISVSGHLMSFTFGLRGGGRVRFCGSWLLRVLHGVVVGLQLEHHLAPSCGPFFDVFSDGPVSTQRRVFVSQPFFTFLRCLMRLFGSPLTFTTPFQPNDVALEIWKEERQGGGWGAGAAPPPGSVPNVAPGATIGVSVALQHIAFQRKKHPSRLFSFSLLEISTRCTVCRGPVTEQQIVQTSPPTLGTGEGRSRCLPPPTNPHIPSLMGVDVSATKKSHRQPSYHPTRPSPTQRFQKDSNQNPHSYQEQTLNDSERHHQHRQPKEPASQCETTQAASRAKASTWARGSHPGSCETLGFHECEPQADGTHSQDT